MSDLASSAVGRAGLVEKTVPATRGTKYYLLPHPTQFLTGGAVQAEERKEWKTNLENVAVDPLSS